jgi:hypothetical protein
MQRDHELTFDKVVIGGSLAALKYAHANQLPIIVHEVKPPHRFSEEFIAGEYGRFCFSLSVAGLLPFSNKVESIRFHEEGPLRVTIKNSFLFKVKFNKLIIFDDEGLTGLPMPSGKTSELYEVIDWFDVRSGMSHGHDRIKTTSDFINCVHFYPTERLDGHHPDKKDAAAVSHMTEAQLDDFGWSETYARLKVLEMMRAAGITGQSCGSSNYALKIETAAREVFPLGKNIYEPTKRLKFIYD